MSAAHTPGPWETNGRAITADVHVIAECSEWLLEFQNERHANARLIAAAPDLLEAGEGLLKAYRVLIDRLADDEFDMAAEHPASWASKMESAIAKATTAVEPNSVGTSNASEPK